MFARDKRIGPYTYVYLVENVREIAQLVQVRGAEAAQPRLTIRGQGDPGEAAVLSIPPPRDHAHDLGAVNEFHHAVVAQQQVVG